MPTRRRSPATNPQPETPDAPQGQASAAEWVACADLVPWDRNPRDNAAAVAPVAESLKRFGFAAPIIAQRGTNRVIAGHTRLLAAKSLGMATVPVRFVDLDDDEASALALADNRLGEIAEWSDDLGALLGEMEASGVHLDGLGWSDRELAKLIPDTGDAEDTEGAIADDYVPESKVGEVYDLGPHRLMCGDSTDAAAVAECLGGAEPLLWLFDPPYDLPFGAWPLLPSVRIAGVWHRGSDAYRWMGATFDGWGVHGLVFRGGVRGQHQPSLPCCMHDSVSVWRHPKSTKAIDGKVIKASGCEQTKDGRPYSVQDHVGGVLTGVKGMSWGKPVVESEILIAYVPRGAVVWDPVAGSGSSLLAAARHGRVWCGSELQPRWADLIRHRWTAHCLEHGEDPGPFALTIPADKVLAKPKDTK